MVDTEETVRAREKLDSFVSKSTIPRKARKTTRKPNFLKNIDAPTLFIIFVFFVMTAAMIIGASYLVCCFIYTIIHA